DEAPNRTRSDGKDSGRDDYGYAEDFCMSRREEPYCHNFSWGEEWPGPERDKPSRRNGDCETEPKGASTYQSCREELRCPDGECKRPIFNHSRGVPGEQHGRKPAGVGRRKNIA